MRWPSAIFFGEPEIRDSHFCQRALNISTSLHVPAWIDTERVELRGAELDDLASLKTPPFGRTAAKPRRDFRCGSKTAVQQRPR